MVEVYYWSMFLLSMLLTLAFTAVWHKHLDVHFTLIFSFVSITNAGYVLYSQAHSIGTAVTANKIIYIGSTYNALFIMLSVFSLCHIEIKRWLRTALMALTSIIYLFAMTMEKQHYYYKSISYERKDGVVYLHKDYAFVHTLFYVMISAYFIAGVWAIIYSYFRKKDVSRKIIYLLIMPNLVSLVAFFGGRKIIHSIELIPAAFVFAQVVFLLIMHRVCLYDITDTGIDSLVEKGDTGFISFDFKYNYLGSNETAKGIFPELLELTVDKSITINKNLGNTFVKWLDSFKADRTKNEQHYDIGEKSYLISINYLFDGNTKRGYQFFITDDTKNRQYISLLNSFNTSLQAEVAEKTEHIVEMHDKLILGMATMVESRDNSTGGHIRRTSEGVRILINEIRKNNIFGLTDEFCRCIIKAAPMHDLGKIAVDDAILRKPGRFTPEEFDKMKAHAAEGAKIVHQILQGTDDVQFHIIAENVAHYHHERWDGSGYPEGLKGEEIPIEAGIMAIADVYDALVSKRVYKEKMSFEQADSIIMEGMGKHFDKALEPYYISARPKLEEYYSTVDQ
ncbi:MAG: HD domain-containing protein [Ruminococcus sp.]|nr:HD domain-containing protein [Ruminococcus sp.]